MRKTSIPAREPLSPADTLPDLGPLQDGGGAPLFRQVKRRLIRLIEARHFAPGDCLPSETELATRLQVSIGTLRKAVDELVFENVLLRRQGKGTFVTQHNNERFLFQFFHVEPRAQDEHRQPEYPQVQCLGFARDRCTEDEAHALHLRPGDPVLRMTNRLSLSGRVVVFDQLCLSALTFKGLTEKRFVERSGTVYQLYQQDFGITVLRAQERARAVAANRETSRVLGVPIGLPVMEVHRIALSFGEKPVEYRVSTINTQHYDYVSTLGKGTGF